MVYQNSLAEEGEVLATKVSPFERLDGVVAAIGEAVGKADVKGLENGIELRKPEQPLSGRKLPSARSPVPSLSEKHIMTSMAAHLSSEDLPSQALFKSIILSGVIYCLR